MFAGPPQSLFSVGNMNCLSIFLVAGIILDFGWIFTAGDNSQEESTFLDAYSVLSLLRYGKKGKPSTDVTVEEVYDASRGSGKVIVRKLDGSRVELIVNLHDKIHLEAEYSAQGKLLDCSVSVTKEGTRSSSGYFGLFETLTEIEPPEKQLVRPDVGSPYERNLDYIVGPSMPIYLYRNKLRSRSKEISSMQTSEAQDLRRMFISSKPVEFAANTPTGNRKLITFKQARYSIERAPLLAQLAAYMSLEDPTNGDFFELDVMSITELKDDIDNPMLMHDHFRLPAWFQCKKVDPGDLFPFNSMKQFWAQRLGGKSRFSALLLRPSHERAMTPMNLQVDLIDRLMRVEIVGKSVNIVDMKRQIIYHLPDEPAGYELSRSEADRKRVQNGACTILDSNALNGINYQWLNSKLDELQKQDKSPDVTDISILAWQFFIGTSDRIMYLGRTNKPADGVFPEIHGLSAHEFEIKYDTAAHLPTPMLMFMSANPSQSDGSSNDVISGRLWILASSECGDLHVGFTCSMPTLLAFELSFTNPETSVKSSQWLRFENFRWDLHDAQVKELRRSGSTFDISRCPLASVKAVLPVRWNHHIQLSMSDSCALSRAPDLDSFVISYMDKLLRKLDEGSPRDFMVASSVPQPIIGVQRARYEIELAEAPLESIKFQAAGKSTLGAILSRQIDHLVTDNSLFECLAYASENYNVKVVLFSPDDGGCFLHEEEVPAGWQPPINRDDTAELLKYERLVFTTALKPDELLNTFVAQDFIPMNEFLSEQAELSNYLEACLDSNTLVRDIRFGQIRAHPDHLHDGIDGAVIYDEQIHFAGFRFVVADQAKPKTSLESSRLLFESGSRQRCRARCDEKAHCASFAYCQYPDARQDLCQLSDLVLNQTVKTNLPDKAATYKLSADTQCEVYSKDYLAFFELDQQANDELVSDVDEVFEINNVTVQECARLCLAHHETTCLWFSQCIWPEQTVTRCLNWPIVKGGHTVSSSDSEDPKVSGTNVAPDPEQKKSPKKAKSNASCKVYKRRPISLFRLTSRYSGLESKWTGQDVVETNLAHLSREECAERCLSSADCSSFDSCLVKSSKNPMISLVYHECRLITLSAFFGRKMSLVKAGQVDTKASSITSAECDHYERKSVLVEHKTLPPDTSNEQKRSSTQISYASQLLVAIAMGLAVGVAANYIYALWFRDPRLFPRTSANDHGQMS